MEVSSVPEDLFAVLDPEVMIVGGGVGAVGGSLLGPAHRVAAAALPEASPRMLSPLLLTGLGPWAGAPAAALLAEQLSSCRLDLSSEPR